MEYSLIVICLTLLEVGYLFWARRAGIDTSPAGRSSHNEPIVTGGGFIFIVAMWVFWFISSGLYLSFLIGLTLVGVVSLADDIMDIGVVPRLLAQAFGVAFMFADMGCLWLWPWWIIALAAVLWIGALNVFNFMDGINGMTCAYGLAVVVPLAVLDLAYGFISPLFLIIAGLALVVFSVFNFRRRALCFAGDVGAVSIGFIVMFALGLLIVRTGDWAYLTLVCVYGVDAVLTIIHRIYLKENLLQPHRMHVYQIMANELGMSHTAVSAIYAGVQILISAGLICLAVNHYVYMMVVCTLLCVAYAAFIDRYFRLHRTGFTPR